MYPSLPSLRRNCEIAEKIEENKFIELRICKKMQVI